VEEKGKGEAAFPLAVSISFQEKLVQLKQQQD
jgi:hypothetical protein